jgi:predicted DNA-binding transcriptional regulator YafY
MLTPAVSIPSDTSIMRASRLLSLLLLLQTRGRVGAAELARRFGVSVRTIYRDIDELSASGVPVYAERGRAGGFALHADYRSRLPALNPREAAVLPFAPLGDAAAAIGVGVEATTAQQKWLSALPGDSARSAQRVAERFHLDPAPWYTRTETLPLLPSLAAAVWSDRRILFRYRGWNSSGERRVHPLGLVLKGERWYLVACDGSKTRSYRVGEITALVVLDESARRPTGFVLGDYWKQNVQRFEQGLFQRRATVRISAAGRRLLADLLPAWLAAVPPDVPAGVDWVETEIPLEDTAISARQLLRLGDDVEVLAPAELRAALIAEAQAIVRRHAGDFQTIDPENRGA